MFKYFVIKHSCVRSNAKTCKEDIVKTFFIPHFFTNRTFKDKMMKIKITVNRHCYK